MTILASGATLTARYEYAGFADYHWGCSGEDYVLYASYGRGTTVRDIVDQLVSDSYTGPASEDLPEEVMDGDVRAALLEMLSDAGRADYESGAVAECAANYATESECGECGRSLADVDDDMCPDCDTWIDEGESPIFIVILDYEEAEEETDSSKCPDYDDHDGCAYCPIRDDCGDREDDRDLLDVIGDEGLWREEGSAG